MRRGSGQRNANHIIMCRWPGYLLDAVAHTVVSLLEVFNGALLKEPELCNHGNMQKMATYTWNLPPSNLS